MRHRLTALFALTFLFLTGPPAVASESGTTTKPITTADPGVPLDDLRVMVKPLTKAELEIEAKAWFELLQRKAQQVAVARLGVRITSDASTAEDREQAAASVEELKEYNEKLQEVVERTEQEVTKAAQDRIGVGDGSTADETGNEPAAVPQGPGETPKEGADDLKNALLSDINQLQDERSARHARLTIVLDSLEEKGGEVEEFRKYAAAVSKVELETSDLESAWSGMIGWLASAEGGKRWGGNLAEFLVLLALALALGKLVAAIVTWLLERKLRLSRLAEKLIANTIKYALIIAGFGFALTAFEIEGTPILAGIGAIGLVAGLALQNSLSNVASGVLILMNRPFDVGDVVTAGGVSGTVDQMSLVSTTLRSFDNQTIHVPNNEIWNNVITNVTANDTRRVDLEFGIGYDNDFEEAEGIIRKVVDDHELVLADPEPAVVTHALADSSVNIVCRPWAKTGDWWQVKTDVIREVKRRFDAAGISIPYPQQEIHITSPKAAAD